MQGLDAHTEFMQVLETIIRDLQLSISLPGKARSAAPVKKVLDAPPRSSGCEKVLKNKGRFIIVEQSYRKEELAFWGRYGIDTKARATASNFEELFEIVDIESRGE